MLIISKILSYVYKTRFEFIKVLSFEAKLNRNEGKLKFKNLRGHLKRNVFSFVPLFFFSYEKEKNSHEILSVLLCFRVEVIIQKLQSDNE